MSNIKGNNYDEFDWGSKKTDYYSRNKTNKDDNDFLEEEEEAKKMQMEKLKKLQEANLLESDDESIEEKKVIKKISLYSSDEEDNNSKNNNKETDNGFGLLINSKNDNKNKRGKKSLLNSGSKLPEKTYSSEDLSEFSQILKNIKINVDELNENVLPIEQVLENEELKLERTLNYFQLKKQAHLLYITYMNFYLYFKAMGKINDHHPVIKKMYFLKSIINSDKEQKEKIFEKIDKTLELINEKKNLEDEENLTIEDENVDENDLDLNEEEEMENDEIEDEEDDFNLDDEGEDDELNAEDILDLNDDFDDHNSKKKDNEKKKNKKQNDEKSLLKNKRNKPDSILDIDFTNGNNKIISNNKNENVEKFVQENLEKLNTLKEKKEKLAEKAELENQKDFEEKLEMGVRLANKNMLKARGIYRKRKQYQGNAKVHNREKYLKKQKLRKNMVKEYEGKPDVYIGETTGIRRDLIRSTKIK